MFIVALFTKAPNQKWPGWPSADKWFNKLWDIHTMKYYLARKWYTPMIYNNLGEC